MPGNSAWGNSWGLSWADSWGSTGYLLITDTDILQKPINCVLAGEVPFKDRWREYQIPAKYTTNKTVVKSSGARRLKGPAPSFTTRTGSKGYD